MSYSLLPQDIRQVLDAKLGGQPYDQAQLLYYHLNRNYFNVKSEVTTLRAIGQGRYIDNLNHIWNEAASWRNYYHMPLVSWIGSSLGISTPFSRKFLRDDNLSGLRGEFEMIIRHDGKRIDALVDPSYQETYNYGRTIDSSAHTALDVRTHNANPNYVSQGDMGKVTITETP